MVAVTSTASSSSSLRSNGQPAASPVSVSAPALLTQMSRPSQTLHANCRQGFARLRSRRSASSDGGARRPAARTDAATCFGGLTRDAGRERSRRPRRRPVRRRWPGRCRSVEPVTRARRPASSRPGDGPNGLHAEQVGEQIRRWSAQHRMHDAAARSRRAVAARIGVRAAADAGSVRCRLVRTVSP